MDKITAHNTHNHPATTPKTMRLLRALRASGSCFLHREPRPVALESSALNAVAYDRRHRALHAEFSNGRRYEYGCVEPREFFELLKADSAGRYFNQAIRNGGYPYRELPSDALHLRVFKLAGCRADAGDSAPAQESREGGPTLPGMRSVAERRMTDAAGSRECGHLRGRGR